MKKILAIWRRPSKGLVNNGVTKKLRVSIFPLHKKNWRRKRNHKLLELLIKPEFSDFSEILCAAYDSHLSTNHYKAQLNPPS